MGILLEAIAYFLRDAGKGNRGRLRECKNVLGTLLETISISYGMRERGTRNRGIRTRLGGLHPPLNVYMAKFDPAERITLPWVTEVFSRAVGIFGRSPKPKLSRAGHYKDLTETGNRKVSGTLGRVTRSSGPATRLGGSPHLSCKRDQIKMRDHMDKRVTPP